MLKKPMVTYRELRALNPQIEKMQGSIDNRVVIYFIHRLGTCLEMRIIDYGL